MKKRINKKRVKAPAYAFGIDQMQGIAGIGGVAGSSMSAFGEEGSGADIAGGALSGAASGASIGMAAGPIGAIAGGVIGLAGGLFKGFNKRKKIREMKRRKETAEEAQLGLNNAAVNESEYWDDNTMAYTYANGGILPDLAYVDNNEIVRDVNGNIDQVPNNKQGTDNHLIDASGLESVLSDKLKRPGTNKTFAQEGEKLIKMTKSSKGTDKFAENTNRLNKANANKRYNQLLTEQEELKNKKGIKPKSKGIPAYQDGKGNKETPTTYGDFLGNTFSPIIKGIGDFINSGTRQILMDYNPVYQGGKAIVDAIKSYDEKHPVTLNSNKRLLQNYGSAPAFYDYAPTLSDYSVDGITGETILTPNTPTVDTPEVALNKMNSSISPTKAATANKKSIQSGTKSTKPNYLDSFDWAPTPPVQVFAGELPGLPTPTLNVKSPELAKTNIPSKEARVAAGKFDIGNLGNLTALAPTLYNFIQGLKGPEIESTVLNPYAGATARTMARRRMNINPAREANRRSRAIANYNAANMNANTGANLAFRTQAAVSEYANNADMYATKQNADNAYLGEYANMMNNLGQQFVQSQTLTNDLNARNRASARNYSASAASQLGEWSQIRKQMKNQQRRDDMIYPLLENFLSQGYTSDQIAQIRKAHGSK